MRTLRTYLLFVAAVATLLAAATTASAHGNEVHNAPPAAGATGGGANPGTIPAVNEPVTGGGAVGGTPANGAQPAAPNGGGTGLPPVVGGSVGNTTKPAATTKPADTTKVVVQPVATGAGTSGATTTTSTSSSMLETISEPVVTKPQTAKGGGAFDDGVVDGGGAAVPDSPVVTGAGDLPFTGIEETILLIALSGMLVPIGVLLYSFARHGEVRWLRRHLAAPRFQWSQAPGMRPDPNRWPDARA